MVGESSQRRPFRTSIRRVVESSRLPMYVLDARRRIIFANSALVRWLGCSAESLPGRPCLYHGYVEPPRDGLVPLHGLAPPPSAVPPEIATGVVFVDRQGCARQYRRAVFVPLGTESPCPVWVAVEAQGCRREPGLPAGQSDLPERLHVELSRFRVEALGDFSLRRLVGTSPAACRVRRQVELAMASDASVVIIGPPGSGREHVARTIHAAGEPARTGPLVPLAGTLLDSQLLRSTRQTVGRSGDRAGGCTILLLDADQLTVDVQAELLAWLDDEPQPPRVLATTRLPLVQLTDQQRMLARLAERLGTLEIRVPALPERREDVPLLAQAAVERFNARGRKQLGGLHPAALDRLVALTWHGDVEELMAVVEQAAEASRGPLIGPSDLPASIAGVDKATQDEEAKPPRCLNLDDYLQDLERQVIQEMLDECRGKRSLAARRLGISRARLVRRIAQLGIGDRPLA